MNQITDSSTLTKISSTLRPSSIQNMTTNAAITTAYNLLVASNSANSPKPLTNTQVFFSFFLKFQLKIKFLINLFGLRIKNSKLF